MLGGSSGKNLMAFDRASAIEYDALRDFNTGDEDWSWSGLLPFFRKSEHVALEPPDTFANYSGKQPSWSQVPFDGFSGPVAVSHSTVIRSTSLVLTHMHRYPTMRYTSTQSQIMYGH